MELLFYTLILMIVIFSSIGLFIPSLITVDEEKIMYNIRKLKEQEWFQKKLQESKFRDLIRYNKEIRLVIGKFNLDKINKSSNQVRYRKKLDKILKVKAQHIV